ncbi:unnamed protein product [Hydatigera taeniaeformis]|uniref:Tetraspanin n=1 Tax=Hydatigena taeniaeformis TaxID=6205 RepID=A0A0R3WRC8_HYDTA|nr:unnamed protein product [Hydatigera taeniaeformis]
MDLADRSEPVAQELIEVSNRRTIATVVLFVLMGLGSLTLIVALFGCCGAYHESPCLLATYFIFLIIIFAIQLSGAAAGYFYKEKIFENTEQRMREGVFEHMKPIPTLNRQPVLMNAVQKVVSLPLFLDSNRTQAGYALVRVFT